MDAAEQQNRGKVAVKKVHGLGPKAAQVKGQGRNPGQHECKRKGVGQLHLALVALGQGDSCRSKSAHLPVKLAQGGTPLVPHDGFGDEAHSEARFAHPNTQFHVFAALEVDVVAHDGPKGFGADAHVKTPRVVGGGGFGGAAADAARGQHRRHGEADGFLERTKVGRGGIGAAEGVPGVAGQAVGNRVEVALGEQAV